MKLLRERSRPVSSRNFMIQMKESEAPPSNERKEEEDETMNVWDCGSPLYDSYELVSLSHVIDRHTMVLPSLRGSRSSSQFSDASNVIPSQSSSSIEDTSKKLGGSAVIAFLSKVMERNVWKRRISSTTPRAKRSPDRS